MAEVKSATEVDFDWQQSRLFRYCDASDWDNFRQFTSVSEEPSGSTLWREGEISELLICVFAGSLEALKKTPDWGKPIIMAQFVSGATVGELVFADISEAHSTTLQVVENSTLLTLTKAQTELLQQEFPTTANKLLRGAAALQLQRMRQVNCRMVALF